MFNVTVIGKRLVLVVTTMAVTLGGAAVHAEDSIEQMLRTIDAANERIAEIVAQLATPDLPSDVIVRLNLEKEDQEWVRGQAQLAIVREREARQMQTNKERRFQVEADQFVAAVQAFEALDRQLQIEFDNHNADADRQNVAVEHFNELPAAHQTQAEANRLNDWGAEVNARRVRLMNRVDDHEAERLRLINWLSRLDDLFAQL